MLLENKTVAIFAATGAVGSAVARRMHREGARLYLSARAEAPLAALAAELGASHAVVDAMDEAAIEAYLAAVAREAGGIDATFNAIGPRAGDLGYGRRATELRAEDFLRTLAIVTGSQFLVARAAARHMAPRGQGAIVTLSASLSAQFVPYMAGISAACAATEGLTRSLAAELGPAGVRVNCVRAGGMAETRTIRETQAAITRTTSVFPAEGGGANLLGRPLRLAEMAGMVTFAASDLAGGVTGQILDVCAGAVVSR